MEGMSPAAIEAELMKGFETLEVVQKDPTVPVYYIYLNRPAERNALTLPFFSDLPRALSLLDAAPSARAIVLSSRGPHFSSGIHLSALSSVSLPSSSDPAAGRAALRGRILFLQSAVSALERCRKPVLAAVHGACIGGGIDLITACDLRYCDASAYFSLKEVDLALTADLGSLQRLPAIVGHGNAMDLALTGRAVTGSEAKGMGLVSRVFETMEEMERGVEAIAREIATKSELTVTGTKAVMLRTRDLSVELGLDYVATWNAGVLMSKDLEEVADTVEDDHMHSLPQSVTQQLSSQEMPIAKKRKSYTRSQNWTVHEDKLLVSAWLNTSQDAIQVTGQHKDNFWQRANDYFIQFSTDPTSQRTPNQMMHRWSMIQMSVNKFCGCMTQIESRQRSDTRIIDQIAEIKEFYQILYDKPFLFEHCWIELRHHQKWIQQNETYNQIQTQPKKTKNSDSSPNNSSPAISVQFNADSDVVSHTIRPEERKTTKLTRKQNVKDKINVDSAESSSSIMDKAYAWMKQNNEQKLELNQKKQDDDIMKMDLSMLNPIQHQYFEMRQVEILKSWMSKGSS